ncbi:FAD-dependent oxidoreductase [Arthrobacter sp. D1-29]
MTDTDVLIVGASAAGLGVLESLRGANYRGRITLLGAETHLPYDRPPLSKQVLGGEWDAERAQLRSREQLDALDARFILGEAATGLNASARQVHTAQRKLTAGNIVIATGTSARKLRSQPEIKGLHTLRTLEDALALREDLLAASRLVVVGEGVLGSEIAATASQLGLDVTITGPLTSPMQLQLGGYVSGLLAELHSEAGVQLRLGVGVTGFTEHDDRVTGVRLADGMELPADIVVVAIGGIPATDWLADSGLTLENGVVCDEQCRAAEGIYAVGDVARWFHSGAGDLVRLENRTNATEQSAVVAAAILGGTSGYEPVPYFWSDQYKTKIQVYGTIRPDAYFDVVEGNIDNRRFVIRYHVDGLVTAVLGWNMPKQTRLRAQEIDKRHPIQEEVAV